VLDPIQSLHTELKPSQRQAVAQSQVVVTRRRLDLKKKHRGSDINTVRHRENAVSFPKSLAEEIENRNDCSRGLYTFGEMNRISFFMAGKPTKEHWPVKQYLEGVI
jgi:hypothetical protein